MLLLFIALAALWFLNLESRTLAQPDEPRYAEIGREMAASGDWVTPRLNDIKYFFKPPLQYWATAAAINAFGEHNWTARLWTALTGLAGIVLLFGLALRLDGLRVALLATCVLAGSSWYWIFGHVNTLDMGLTFFMSALLGAWLLALAAPAPSRATSGWALLGWAALALATLSKGIVALVIPAGAFGAYMLLTRQWWIVGRLLPVRGTALPLLICAPWFIAVTLRNPEFPGFFFLHEHFARFLGASHGRPAPWWFFVVVQLVGFLPWTSLMVPAVLAGWRRAAAGASPAPRAAFDGDRLLVLWCVFTLLFFSLSQSKLPAYTLPLWPALALLCGRHLAQVRSRTLALHLGGVACVALLALAATAFIAGTAGSKVPPDLLRAFAFWLGAGFALLAAGLLLAAWLAGRGRVVLAITCAMFASGGAWQTMLAGHEALAPVHSVRDLVEQVRPLVGANTRVYSVATYEQSLPWLLKRPVTLVQVADEFEFGLRSEPQRAIPTIDAFIAEWEGQPDALALMRASTYEALQARAVPMTVAARNAALVLVRKPERPAEAKPAATSRAPALPTDAVAGATGDSGPTARPRAQAAASGDRLAPVHRHGSDTARQTWRAAQTNRS